MMHRGKVLRLLACKTAVRQNQERKHLQHTQAVLRATQKEAQALAQYLAEYRQSLQRQLRHLPSVEQIQTTQNFIEMLAGLLRQNAKKLRILDQQYHRAFQAWYASQHRAEALETLKARHVIAARQSMLDW